MSTFEQEIKIKLNALKEQNDKLIGSMKALEATNEHIVLTNEKLKDDLKKTKKAFDDVFIRNIGNAWENYNEDKKKKMSLSDKAGFLTKEINLSKIYIRDSLEKKHKEITGKLISENKKLQAKVKELQFSLSQIDKNFVNDIKTKSNDTDNLLSKDIEQKSGGGYVKRTEGNKSALGMDKFKKEENTENTSNNNEKPNNNSFLFSKNESNESNESNKSISQDENIDDIVKKSLENKKETEKFNEKNDITNNDDTNNEDTSNVNEFANDNELMNLIEKNKVIELDYATKWADLSDKNDKNVYSDKQRKIIESIQRLKLNEFEVNLIKIIGSKGYFTINVVSKKVPPEFTSKLYPARNKLIEYKLLVEGKPLKIGGHGRPASTFMLTDLGCWFYLFAVKKNPVDSLLKSIAKNQKSTEHGFHITQIIALLEDSGYNCIQEDVKITNDGKKSICDILAKKELKEYRIEYEEGNYSRNGYFNKFTNILDVTDKLIFITYNNEVREKLKKLFLEYINEKYNGLDSFKKAHKHYLFISMSDLQKDHDSIYKFFNYTSNNNYHNHYNS